MRPNLVTAAGWTIAASLLVVVGVQYAASQASFPEGAFVVAQDGTRWIVTGDTRYSMSFITDDANVIPALAEGDTVIATVAEANAVLGRSPASTSAPAAQPAPAALLLDVVGGSDRDTDRFVAPGPRIEICWDVTSTTAQTPSVTFWLWQAREPRRIITRFDVRRAESSCSIEQVTPGEEYYIDVDLTGTHNR